MDTGLGSGELEPHLFATLAWDDGEKHRDSGSVLILNSSAPDFS
jgi:hypothetical protein